jgi:hypothetical protein
VVTSTQFRIFGTFPVRMRAAPAAAMTVTNPVLVIANAFPTGAGSSLGMEAIDPSGFRCIVSGFSGQTAGQAACVATPGLLTFDAEL